MKTNTRLTTARIRSASFAPAKRSLSHAILDDVVEREKKNEWASAFQCEGVKTEHEIFEDLKGRRCRLGSNGG